jgi:plasmid rolling circle replication initiator protein Rep
MSFSETLNRQNNLENKHKLRGFTFPSSKTPTKNLTSFVQQKKLQHNRKDNSWNGREHFHLVYTIEDGHPEGAEKCCNSASKKKSLKDGRGHE